MHKKFFFIAYFFISLNCFAQQYPFVHYTPKDGLVNSRVRKAFQDSRGRMYFMTFGGLSVYDGARFTNYTVDNGLASDLVNDMIEMGEDSLWVACNINALNYLRNGKIKTFNTADGFCPTINKFIKCRNGIIYVVADEGLFVFKENRFTRLPFTNNNGKDAGRFLIDAIKWNDLILILSDNTLSHLVSGNLYVFNTRTNRLSVEDETNHIITDCVGTDNNIYISDSRGVLQIIDTAVLLKGHIRLLPPPGKYRNIAPGMIYMNFDSRNNLWLYSANNKLIKVDPDGSIKEFSRENGLSSNSFSAIFHDKEGSAWITMDGSGIDKLVNDNIEQYEKFMSISVSNHFTNDLTDSVYLYSWPGKKMVIVDSARATEYQFTTNAVFPNASCVSGGNIYLSDGKSLYLLKPDKEKHKIATTLLFKDTTELTFGNFLADPYGNLILAGTSYITILKDYKPIYRYPVKDYIDQMAIDKMNRLWAASRARELYVFEINPDNHTEYLHLLKNYDKGYPALSARSLAVDKMGNLWIGTRHDGLYCFQFDKDLAIRSTQHYTTKEGLSDNFIMHLTCDKENNIWVSTSSGLDKIRYANNKIQLENITRSNNIYEQILKTFVNKKGIAWSNTVDGKLIRISKSPVLPAFIPSLIITSLKVGNTSIDNFTEANSFSYTQNSFSISVAATSFYDEQQIKYSYLLQGSSNDQWSESSNNSTFNFINLNPGQYTLKIKAIFPGSRYADQVIDYAFVIHPPWWQTVLFRLIAASSIMGLLIIASRLYYRRKLEKQRIALEKQQAVEKERTRIATDIHDDLGSGLSRIRYLGEMVKLKSSQQQNILPDIEKIAVFSDEMVDKMNEIVWALNEKNDSLEAIISYARSFAAEYLSNNNIDCKVNLPDEIPPCIIKGETRRNIFLSVKECLHNIVKHAGATQTNIAITVNDHLIICIHDNGKGIDWENMRPFSNGIINLKKRMKDAGGSVDFNNESGTTVTLSIPL